MYRNTLWPHTPAAGAGLAQMISHQYPNSIPIFPAEVGDLIAQSMLWVNSTNNPSNQSFQDIAKNLNELTLGVTLEKKANNS
jgi:hypothetical protein